MKSKFLNFKLNKVMETNLDTACEKLNMSRSDIGRLALSMLFEAYLEPVDMGRQDVIRDSVFSEEEIAEIIKITSNVVGKM